MSSRKKKKIVLKKQTKKRVSKRKLYLFGEITDESAGRLAESIISLNDSNEDVYLYICSEGGDIYAGMAILDAMGLVDYDINTIVTGYCASMASIIAMCGTKGKRFITRNSCFLYHCGTDSLEGTVDSIKQNLMEFERLENRFNKLVAKRTGKSLVKIKKDIKNKDFILNASQAIKYKAFDSLWTKTRERKSNE